MDGTCFEQHRQSTIQILKKYRLEKSIAVIYSPISPTEAFTECSQPFYQDGFFYYLSGSDMSNCILIIDISTGKSILITPPLDQEFFWHHKAFSSEQIRQQTGVSEVLIGANPEEILSQLVSETNPLFLLSTDDLDFSFPKVQNDLTSLICAVAISRRIKFPHEIEALRRAATSTALAIVDVMKMCQPGMNEYFIASSFHHFATVHGGRILSFPTIVASGSNASCLHYFTNDRDICDGDLVLIDCGICNQQYKGDVSRTFPINGHFSPIQRTVYSKLLSLQKHLCSLVRPGFTQDELNTELENGIYEIAKSLEIVSPSPFVKKHFSRNRKNFEKVLTKELIIECFCPHSVGHHIGASEHDLIGYETRSKVKMASEEHANTLRAGMVITIEPGFYFNEISMKDLEGYKGFNSEKAKELAREVGGIRIEDDVLVTENGYEILSSACPKEIDEIEALMAKKSQ